MVMEYGRLASPVAPINERITYGALKGRRKLSARIYPAERGKYICRILRGGIFPIRIFIATRLS